MKNIRHLFPLLALAPAFAADITWSTPTIISGDGDIPASALWAYHLDPIGTSAPVTLNGTTFAVLSGSNTDITFTDLSATAFAIAGTTVFSGSSSDFTSLSAGYQALLGGAGYWDNASGRVTLNQLTVGTTYTFRLWGNDSRHDNSVYNRAVLADDGAGHTATYALNNGTAGGSVGRFLDGTFTADAATQSFTLAKSGSGVAQLNAIALSATAIPEPSTYGLLGASALAAAALVRRRARTAKA